jgi:phospholipid/cholesterol/gamma-HCH transport system substrate-binding protein
MKSSLETKLGVFFALALIAAVIILEMAGGSDLFKRGYHVSGFWNNVLELKEGDLVKMAGKPIGRVEKIDFADEKVKVVMKLESRYPVKTDSKATIKFAGLMGQNYVSVTLGSPKSPAFEEGGVIDTTEQADLSAIMAKLDNVASGVENITKTFSGDSIQNVLGPMTDFLKQNNPKLTAIIGNIQTISTKIADGDGTVGKLIHDPALYNSALNTVTNLNSTADDLKAILADAKSAVTNVQKIVAEIGEGKGTVGKLLKDDSLHRETTNALAKINDLMDGIKRGEGSAGKLLKDEKLYAEASTAMTQLKEILQKINSGQGSVGKLVNDDSLFKNAKMTLQKLDKATEGLEDQGPLSILGIAVQNLF